MAIALERPVEQLAPARVAGPPGSLPIEAVRSVARRYERGTAAADELVATVDRHGDALEASLARNVVEDLAAFQRSVRRLEVLHKRLAARLAQWRWLAEFPSSERVEVAPLTYQLDGRSHEIPRALEAMRELRVDERILELGAAAPVRRGNRIGAGASMVALAEAGLSVGDVALELGISNSHAWNVLNGRLPVPEGLEAVLRRLAGADAAHVILASIPDNPRARRGASPAMRALRAAGATPHQVAALIPVTPRTVNRWLAGTDRPPEKLPAVLEQLLGPEHAQRVLVLIPRDPSRDPSA